MELAFFSLDKLLGVGLSLPQPLLGQIVNVGFGPAGILGVFLAVAGAALYFLRSMRPELARDHDIFFAAVGLLCGGILFFQGWRLDPILLFGQILLTSTSVFFAAESIRLRGVSTDQAKRNSPPIMDEDRPVSRVYRAELDELEPSEDIPPVRRIRSARDGASRNRPSYADEWGEEEPRPPRRPSSRAAGSSSRAAASTERPTGERPPRRRSPRSEVSGDREVPPQPTYDRSGRPPSRPARPSSSDVPPRSRRNPGRSAAANRGAMDGDYVDYQPLDPGPRREDDNSSGFDDQY